MLTQGSFGNYKLIIQRSNEAGVFSGDFSPGAHVADPLSSLQRTFVGSLLPLEVFHVNSSVLSPQALCEQLRKYNSGEAGGMHLLLLSGTALLTPRSLLDMQSMDRPRPDELRRFL